MIKECKVKLNNSAVTVVAFGDVEVQFPAINKDSKTVFVKYENGRYSIVDEDISNDSVTNPAKNQSKKAKKKQSVDGIDADVSTRNISIK